VSYLVLGRTFAWDEELERKVAALTPEAVIDAMRRRIDPARLSFVKAGDFAKVAAGPAPARAD
jgi:zinc protease